MAKPDDCAGGTNAPLPLPSAPSIVTQRYRICALCNIDRGDDVERLMRQELRTPAIRVDQIAREGHSSRHLVRVVAVVSCVARARSVLFRLVNRLGLDAGVRSIRWETVPPCIAGRRFAAPELHSTAAYTPERVGGASR
jgi:hypothetical protein